MKLFLLLSLAILSLAALSVSGQRCGSQAGGALCANNLCCSEHGYCGSTTDYCGARCQSQCGGSSGRCGSQAVGALCPNGACCSEHGYCGTTTEYCGARCQSQCGGSPPPTSSSDIGRLISSSLFDQMLKYRNDPRCNANGFYQYSAFITAAQSFPGFGSTGTDDTRKREIAAFFGQTSHETTGRNLTFSLPISELFKDVNCCMSSQMKFILNWKYYWVQICRRVANCAGWSLCLGVLPFEGGGKGYLL